MTRKQQVSAMGAKIAERWKELVAIASIAGVASMTTSAVTVGKSIPTRVTRLEQDTITLESVLATANRSVTRLNRLEPPVAYLVCKELQRDENRDGEACKYLLGENLGLFLPRPGESK